MNFIRLIILLLIVFLSACENEKSKIAEKNSKIDSTKYYFDKYLTALEERGIYYPTPIKYLIQKPGFNEKDLTTPFQIEIKNSLENLNYAEKYFDSFYNSINEPNIKKIIKHGETIFRFTYKPSRELFHYTFRINDLINSANRDHSYSLIVKRYNNNTFIDYNKDSAIVSFERSISKKEFDTFIDLINKSLFWSLSWDDRKGYDGSYWTLEGAIRYPRGYSPKLKYNIFSIWAPDEGCFKDACEYLIKLYGKDIGPIY